jgi:C_GCAxxG_C_C family probable redox protein
MARSGNACGAVTGAMMVIGLKFASADLDPEAKARRYATAHRLFEEFRLRDGSIMCRNLLGFDIGTEKGWSEAQERDTHHTVCPTFVRDVCQILERILEE